MSRILFYMKQSRHRTDSLSFMRKLEAQGFSCRMCGESDESSRGGEIFPADFGRKSFSFAGERALVITDDAEAAGICEQRKIACIGYCPSGLEETELEESVLSGYMEKSPTAEVEKGSTPEESRESGYFPHVRMVWESFADRKPEELEQFRCRFYGEPVVIARTERLLIRESIPEDFEAIYRMESDGEFCRENNEEKEGSGIFRTAKKEKDSLDEEREKFCSYIKNVYSFYGYGYWTVELAEPGGEGTVIGRCGLKDYEPGEDDRYIVMKKEAEDGSQQVFPPELFCLELGYVVAEPYRRQGYAYEMCQAVLDYAFFVLCADVVVVRIHPQNKASLELARKLGFLNSIL